MTSEMIIIRGARQHNLKGIDIDIPRNRLIVITGLSGSGKSTLAFDTIYAEGQRRYVESLSTYARQFLERMEKPDVERIEGLSPAIAIEQKPAGHNPRSTVGTVTEIYDFLRLFYARVGTPHCYRCGQPITSETLDQFVDRLLTLPDGARIVILAPLVENEKGSHRPLLKRLVRDGFARVRIDGILQGIEETDTLDPDKRHTLEVAVDRLIIKASVRNRLADSLELAAAQSDGRVTVIAEGMDPMVFNETAACSDCRISYAEFTPASFSFNSPHGACTACDGLGSIMEFDPDLIIPDPKRSLREGAISPWENRNSVHLTEYLDAFTRHFGTDIYTPYGDLPPPCRTALLYGSGDIEIEFYFEDDDRRHKYKKPFEGIIPALKRQLTETESAQAREEIQRFMGHCPCPTCRGGRLNDASRSVSIGGRNISEVTALSINEVRRFLGTLAFEGKKQIIAERILREIVERLGFLSDVGLGYLTLNRTAHTLSGGESQRIRLATQVGTKLTGVLYVLDEPSIGLHQRDNRKLLDALIRMRDLGNSVLVVEHDEETIRAADHVIDMGPGAGVRGGHVVFSGPPEALVSSNDSLTGQYLSGRRRIDIPVRRRPGNGNQLILRGASQNNLKSIDAVFPLGCLTCVTGVSGSGKSTLVLETLYQALSQHLYQTRRPTGTYRSLEGLEHIDKVINIDQSPIGRTPRSNPGTYTGVLTFIRQLFSQTPEARIRGYKPGRFSFNIKGGRCEACGGDGIVKIEMHFLPDVYVPCDVCGARRYNRETLEIRYKGKNIVDVLDMTVNQAYAFFQNIGHIRTRLQTLVDVGIGYIRLGQPATTLSGGEAQRIKLSKELSKTNTGRTLYVLDEPTTGLHPDDIRNLLNVLARLADAGNTIIVIEHNLDVIKSADHIIDLGPEGGDQGGNVVAFGTPEELADAPGSDTGRYLREVLLKG